MHSLWSLLSRLRLGHNDLPSLFLLLLLRTSPGAVGRPAPGALGPWPRPPPFRWRMPFSTSSARKALAASNPVWWSWPPRHKWCSSWQPGRFQRTLRSKAVFQICSPEDGGGFQLQLQLGLLWSFRLKVPPLHRKTHRFENFHALHGMAATFGREKSQPVLIKSLTMTCPNRSWQIPHPRPHLHAIQAADLVVLALETKESNLAGNENSENTMSQHRKAGSGCPMGGWSVTQHYANGGFPVFHGLDLMVGKMVTKDTSQCITSQYITNVRNPMTNPCSHPDQSCICKWQCFGGPVCGDVWDASTSRRWLGAKGSQEPQLQQPQWMSCRKNKLWARKNLKGTRGNGRKLCSGVRIQY